MPLKSYYDTLLKSDIKVMTEMQKSSHPIQKCNNQWRSNVFMAFCNELFLNKRQFLLVRSRMTDQ